jgi:hypothetical protein
MRTIGLLSIILTLLGLSIAVAFAQNGGPYNQDWNTEQPGGLSSGASYTNRAVIGQSEVEAMTGGSFTFHSGYLVPGNVAGAPGAFNSYLPVILKPE